MTGFIVLAVAAVMVAVEWKRPGRLFPRVPGWWRRAAYLNGIQLASVLVAGVAWDRWMQGRALFDGAEWGTAGGAWAGYFTITFIYYWWHRARHEVPVLWRLFHQVHHSPQRIEIITSFYKHPLEVVVNGLLSSAILYMLLGITPAAATIAVLATGLAELVYHWNVRTPYWLGFFFQRPESHCVHHQAGHHTHNFSDLPLWDMLFGTFHNPREFEEACGFGEHEHELLDMLVGKDVSR
jgi:sterol desaturase/sphingolipid hydroxylase (fatty acid hydroxylase superfamily)